jgi:hypothetical protein
MRASDGHDVIGRRHDYATAYGTSLPVSVSNQPDATVRVLW